MPSNQAPADLSQKFFSLLKQGNLTASYSPVISLAEQKIIAHEATICGTPENSFSHWFFLKHIAASEGVFADLESLALEAAIAGFGIAATPGKLFFAISIESLFSPSFLSSVLLPTLDKHSMPPENLVLKIGDVSGQKELVELERVTQSLRLLGVQVALAGAGVAEGNMRMWSELRPEFIKLDRYFLEGIQAAPIKKDFIRAFRDVALRLNCHLIAEGVESVTDFQEIRALGLRLAQGNYFAPPCATPQKEVSQDLFLASTNPSYKLSQPRSNTIECLIAEVPFVRPSATVEEVADLFHSNPEIQSFPVVNELHAPVGIVRRNSFMHLFLKRYGRELHGRKPVGSVMETNHIVFDVNMLVEEVSLQLTSHFKLLPEQDFIICEKGAYRGVGKIMELLAKITELQIRNARYANPLTQIPGNVPICEYIENLLQKNKLFVVAYCDLDHFKPFNDVYGYEKGDLVIQALAKILLSLADPQKDFVGHIGGDDFIVVLRSENWHSRCLEMLEKFEAAAPAFYSENDRQRGGIVASDRNGEERFFPILSLSIGALVPHLHGCTSYNQIASMAADAKHSAKKQIGNSLFTKHLD